MPGPYFTSRRSFLLQSASVLALPPVRSVRGVEAEPFARVAEAPAAMQIFSDPASTPSPGVDLSRQGDRWQAKGIEVTVTPGAGLSTLQLKAPGKEVSRLHLRWLGSPAANLLYLGDHWERSYGDLAWRHLEPERILPWYFLATGSDTTHACGVKTGAAALCFWQVDSDGISLWLDLRNGGRAVQLRDRELLLATLVGRSYKSISTFAADRHFCQELCSSPRLPVRPVYGGNNWYYAYGKSSASEIRSDSERVAKWADSNTNRPYMVIDDGWQPNRTAGPWASGNADFPDMAKLAADMRGIGVEPGLWVRPLFTREEVAPSWRLQSPQANKAQGKNRGFTLDPTVPEVLEMVRADIERVAGWGYQLIKHDFSTYDLLGRWGFDMAAVLTEPGWGFSDGSRTTAEIVLAFYRTIREAAGQSLVLGCNTIGHLGAGLFELQRTGDDTSGRDWNRTRKMGVNTLAFRACQHNTFFAIDADCVGLTKQVAWQQNRQWLDLLARSGTPLFVSAAPSAVGPEEEKALRAAFHAAATVQPVGEPLDWLTSSEPEHWRLGKQNAKFDWFTQTGGSPFIG